MSMAGTRSMSRAQPCAVERSTGARLHLRRRHGALDLVDGFPDRGLGAAVDEHPGAHAREPQRGGVADAHGRAGDQRHLARKIEVHGRALLGPQVRPTVFFLS
jgi:hypothetical protein